MAKSKIVVESVESKVEESVEPETKVEEPEVKVEEPLPDDVISCEEDVTEPKPKAKARGKAKAKQDADVEIEKAEVPTEPKTPAPKRRGRPTKTIKEAVVVVEKKEEPVEQTSSSSDDDSKKEDKKAEKVKCEDCGKMVSAKTLKYTHKANCKAKKCETPTPAPVPAPAVQNVIPHKEVQVVTHVIDPRQAERAMRLQKRSEAMAKLAAQAF